MQEACLQEERWDQHWEADVCRDGSVRSQVAASEARVPAELLYYASFPIFFPSMWVIHISIVYLTDLYTAALYPSQSPD